MTIQTTATLSVGDKCLDYSSWRDYPELARLGVKCSMRYMYTGAWSSWWKAVAKPEVDRLHSMGIGVLLMFEAGQVDPLQGFGKGATHGRQAAASAEALGYPYGLPIFAAVDFDAVPANIDVIEQYMRGFRSGLALKYATGVYGDTDIIGRCATNNIASYFHYAGATSWSHHDWLDIIHLRQSITGGVAGKYDNNYVFRDVPMWLPHDVPDPDPVIAPPLSPQEHDMSTYVQLDTPARFYDSRDPAGPNKLQANIARDIYTGHQEAKVAVFHAEAVEADGSGHLVFWDGSGTAPGCTSVGIVNGYGQSQVTAPVVNGNVTVQCGVATHLVLDLQAIIT